MLRKLRTAFPQEASFSYLLSASSALSDAPFGGVDVSVTSIQSGFDCYCHFSVGHLVHSQTELRDGMSIMGLESAREVVESHTFTRASRDLTALMLATTMRVIGVRYVLMCVKDAIVQGKKSSPVSSSSMTRSPGYGRFRVRLSTV